MTALTSTDFEHRLAKATGDDGPLVETTPWGYVLRDGASGARAGLIAATGGRFLGAILLMAAAGLWIMPDALYGAEVFAMKLGAMVMFTIFGGWFAWAGQRGTSLVCQVDTSRGELRVGSDDLRGTFQLKGQLLFAEITSVFLVRSKDHDRPTRLFIRVGEGNDALELAQGGEARLEALRARLARDLARGAAPAPMALTLAPRRPRPAGQAA